MCLLITYEVQILTSFKTLISIQLKVLTLFLANPMDFIKGALMRMANVDKIFFMLILHSNCEVILAYS